MKNIFYTTLLALLFVGCSNKPAIEANYQVVPLPNGITKGEGNGFALKSNTQIAYPKGNDAQRQNADFLAEYIKFSTGLELKVTDSEVSDNVIILKADAKDNKAEGYTLKVDDKAIVINGTDNAGTFYGIQTLRKSIPAESTQNQVIFPAVSINDAPRFEYRGMMLDVSRHFFPVEFIKRYIDILALHNINRFHWHLTEDQGWRIEIKKYPKLTEIGSQREQTVIGRNSDEFDGEPYGGFYTQEQIKDVVAYAQKRYITIIPEIDLPGHMLAALTSYPNLGCTGGPYKVAQQWGVFDDVLCAGNEEVYTFLEDVYGELIELFPSEYIHIGGDECPKTRWKTCSKCQAKINELGLKADATHSKEDRLQSYVITRMEQFLNSKGRQIIGWDEILEGGLAPNATVMSWRGMEGGVTAAKQGNKAIMTPTSHLYFDYYQTTETGGEPLAFGGYVPVEKVYSFEPVSPELTADEAKYIIGTQGNLWTEYVLDGSHVEYMVLPRMAALSEVQWTQPEKKNIDQFYPRLWQLIELYKKQGYNYAQHVTGVIFKSEPQTDKGTIGVSLITCDNAPVHYTTDGTEPNKQSPLYTKTIEVATPTTIKAIAIRGNEQSKVLSVEYKFNKATARSVTLENEPHKRYTANGALTLVDGKEGGNNYGDGTWIGFVKDAPVATVDLGKKTDFSEVQIATFVNQGDWVFGASEFEVLVSDDNKNFKRVFHQKLDKLPDKQPSGRTVLTATFDKTEAQYVRIIVKNLKQLPAWHSGKGNPAFVFLDEISIN